MIYAQLGKTSFKVSKICFGALTIGPLQSNLSVSQGADVIKAALDGGINFIDTAELYGTYPQIKAALKGHTQEVIIASKSYAFSQEQMAKSLELARKELGRDRVEIFLLHEQESYLTIKGHWDALEYLLRAKEKGLVGAVGISTHAVAAVEAALGINEIDVIHPMLNMKGLGIIDGTAEDMLKAVRKAFSAGKGIYSMKPIGGGNLMGNVKKALDWSFHLDCIHSVAIGMKSPAEVKVNISWLLGEKPDVHDLEKVTCERRRLHIEDWCEGCGKCINSCPQGAMTRSEGKVKVDIRRCVICGYCGAACPNFCIKII